MGSRRRVFESAAEPRVRARLTARSLGWYRGGRCRGCVTGARGAGRGYQGRSVTVTPAAPRLIDRGDLVAALDRAAASKVTVISAPAGSGKTSLLRAWAGRPGQPRRLALVQVQRGQQDAQQFWLALLGAVRHASATAGRAEPPAAAPDFNAPAMVDRVLSELADAHGGVTLVIDDLHELHSPEAPAQLTRLLTNLPPNVHAILTTRHDMQLRLHQLRLAGELAEIRAADLRFTERETRELLDASGIALSDSGAALLHQRTEGWAAGLRLAALSLVGHPDPERFVAEFSGSDRTRAIGTWAGFSGVSSAIAPFLGRVGAGSRQLDAWSVSRARAGGGSSAAG